MAGLNYRSKTSPEDAAKGCYWGLGISALVAVLVFILLAQFGDF